MKRFFWGLAAGLLIVSYAGTAAAEVQTDKGGFNVVTSPPSVALATDPGKPVSTELRIKNRNKKTERIKVGLMKFGAAGEDGTPTLQERGPNDDYFDWVHLSQTEFDAPYDTWISVKVTINPPATAGLGYYYAVTFRRASQGTQKGASNYVGAAATLLLLDVGSKNAKRQLDITQFSSNKHIYEFLPADFTIKVRNSGNIHAVALGNVFIKRGDKQIASIDVNTNKGSILPNTNRVFKASWSDGFPQYIDKYEDDKPLLGPGGRPQRKLSWNYGHFTKLRFGKYTARVIMVYNDGQRDVPVQGVVSFWVIPWRIVGVLLLIILLIGLGLYSFGRNLFRYFRGAGKSRARKTDTDK